MKIERPIAFIDTETTGPDPVADRIVEFGVVVLAPDGSRAEWRTLIYPEDMIPAEATAVHGITDADVANAPKFSDVAGKIYRGLQGKDIGGYNVRRFDLPIIDQELRRCGYRLNLDGVRVLDSFGIFSKKEPRKLEDAVRRYCHREHEGAHGAVSDAQASADVLLAQVEEYEDLKGMSLDELAAFSQTSEDRYADIAGKLLIDDSGEIRFNFGKHKGKLVKEERGYVRWMLRQDNFPGSTLDVVESVINGQLVARKESAA